MRRKSPEQVADELLEEWARSQTSGDPGAFLRRLGILNRNRLDKVRRREIPMSRFERREEVEDYE